MGRTIRMRDTSHEATFELNLAPMMDMMVSIIPFLLLSITFLQVMIIDSPLPLPVAKALAEDRQKTEREVSINLRLNKVMGFQLEVRDLAGKISKVSVPLEKGVFDYANLHKRLVEIKVRHPKVFRLDVSPEENVDYNTIVKTMDAARSMEKGDQKIMIDNAETPLLFPDAILANVME